MKSKIFKVIGIVLVSILAFVGVVVGILAIRGKFKKQKIYPAELFFENTNFVVVNNDALDDEVHLHSFMLVGRNGDKTVNQKKCYIRFVQRDDSLNQNFYGEELITLCYADKSPIPIETQGDFVGFYQVNCNEPIYYIFNPLDENSMHYKRENFGKVVIEAYDESKMIKSSNQLVFNVDKSVEEIKLQDVNHYVEQTNPFNNRKFGYQTQILQLGNFIEFNYDISPEYSAFPFSDSVERKLVELYYNDTSIVSGEDGWDYALINTEFANQSDFINEIDGTFVFEPKQTGNYQFIYAIFDSFEAKNSCPATMFNYERVQDHMIYTVLDVTVISEMADVVNVNDDADINFNLYQNNTLTLNGEQTLMENDLGLTIDGGTSSELFNLIELGVDANRFWADTNLVFKTNGENEKSITLTKNSDLSTNYTINQQNLTVDENVYSINCSSTQLDLGKGRIIESLTFEDEIYYAQNGIAFVDENSQINLLRAGSYLQFVNYNTDLLSFRKTEKFYDDVEIVRNGAQTQINFLTTSMPEKEENEELQLLVMVVNSNGSFVLDSVKVSINPVGVVYSLTQDANLTINYSNTQTIYGELNFEDIAAITSGSYNAGVFVTEFNEQGYNIEVLPNLTFSGQDGKTYVVVGVLENGQFKNIIRATDKFVNGPTSIYLMFLKNAYQQTAEEFINTKNLNEEQELTAQDVDKIVLETPVTINCDYKLNFNALNFDFNASSEYEQAGETDKYLILINDTYHVLEGTGAHKLKISAQDLPNMLKNLADEINVENFVCYFVDNNRYEICQAITIENVIFSEDENAFIVEFSVFGKDLFILEQMVIAISYDDSICYSPKIILDSNKIENLKFNFMGDEQVLPSEIPNQAGSTCPTIDVVISLEEGEYVYNYNYNGNAIENINSIFNADVFVPSPKFSNREYNFAFTSSNESVLAVEQNDGYSLRINKIGTAYLCINCNEFEALAYLRFNVTTENGFSFQLNNPNVITENNDVKLSDCVLYKFGEIQLTDAKYFNLSNIKSNNSNLTVQQDEAGYKLVDVNTGDEYITISIQENDWHIIRNSKYTYTNIQLLLEISVATQSIPLTLQISFNNSITVDLNSSYNASIYANTNVLLKERITSASSFSYNSIFRITENELSSNNYLFTYSTSTNSNETEVDGEQINLPSGNYIFKIYLSQDETKSVDDKLLATYNLRVLPNVVFSQTNEQMNAAKNLESDSNYNLTNLVTIQKYDSDSSKIYGQNASYSSENLVDFANEDYVNLSLSSNSYLEQNILSLTDNNTKIQTLWLTDLDDQVNKSIKLCYGTAEFNLNVIIKNKYINNLTYNNPPFVISARVEYSQTPVSISLAGENWVLKSITDNDGRIFSVNPDTHEFSLVQDLSNKIENTNLTFTFENATSKKELSYKNFGNENGNAQDVIISLTPNTPPTKINEQNEVVAISGTQFDIFSDVFNLQDVDASEILSMEIISATNGNVFNSQILGLIYNFAHPGEAKISLNEISGDVQTSKITYRITYPGEVTYDHELVLTIKNRQAIELIYPYADYGKDTAINNLHTTNLDAETEQYLQGVSTISCYEPVNVGQTITFGNSSRVKVLNRAAENEVVENQIEKIEWAAYSGLYYSNMVTIVEQNNNFNVTFDANASIRSAFVVLKITTKSGNYAFYFLHLYNQRLDTRYSQTNSNHTWQINVQPAQTAFYSTNQILGETFDRDLLYNQFKLQSIVPSQDNFKLYLLDATLLGTDENAFEKLGLAQFALLNNENLSALTQFATLKIALVYIGAQDNAEIYLGNIIVYVKSNQNVSITNPEVKTALDGTDNGNYVYDWQTSSNKEFLNPFNLSSGAEVSIETASEGFKIYNNGIYLASDSNNATMLVGISNGAVVRQKYVTVAYSFVVRYTYNLDGEQLVMFVTFNMQATEVPTSTQNYTISYSNGKFVEDLTIEMGGYHGEITWQIDNNNVTLTPDYAAGAFTLHFALQTRAYNATIVITYADIANATRTRTIKVAVDSAVYVNFPVGSNGRLESAPLTATKNDNLYQSEDASSITISKSGNEFSVENLKIITQNAASLKIEINSNSKFVTSNLDANINGTTTINFAHSAMDNVVVELLIKIISNGESYQNINGEDIIVPLYIKVPQTYFGITPTYLTNGADHENVFSNQTIENIRDDLFKQNTLSDKDYIDKTAIYSSSKIKLIGVEDKADLTKMGFTNSNNVNYINIDANPDSAMVKTLQNGNLIFPEISARNTLTSIVLSNDAGVPGVSYQYQVMRVDKEVENSPKLADGLNPLPAQNNEYIFKVSNPTHSASGKYVQMVDYSFVSSNDKSNFSTENLTIANLLDERNNALFINEIKNSTNLTLITDKDNPTPSRRAFNSDLNQVEYTLNFANSAGKHAFTLILTRTANMELQIKLTQDAETTLDDSTISFEFTFIGNGGQFKMSLNFYNCILSNKSFSLQAGRTHTLSFADLVKINSNSETITRRYEYNQELSSYTYLSMKTLKPAYKNNIFEIETINPNITLYSIIENAEIRLGIDVYLNGNLVGHVYVDITSVCGLEYKINNDEIITGRQANQTDEYNYYMTDAANAVPSGSFAYTIDLFDNNYVQNSSMSSYHDTDKDKVYYDSINITLFNESQKIGLPSINVLPVDELDNDLTIKMQEYFTIDKSEDLSKICINFKKDFTGAIILKLSAVTSNGMFERYLTLNVLGFVSIYYPEGNTENTIIETNGGRGFDSSTNVTLISNADTTIDVGLLTSTTLSDYSGVGITVSYLILPYQANVAIPELFKDGKAITLDHGQDEETTLIRQVKLPNVPMSSPQNSKFYTVIYRIAFNYLGQDSDYYYVSYKVKNDTKVNSNKTSFNADTEISGSSLLLFNYYIKYTADGNNYFVYLDGTNIKLYDETNAETYTLEEDSSTSTNLVFKNAGKTITIEDATSSASITTTDKPKTSATKIVISSGENNMFNISYSSFFDFKEFVSLSVKLTSSKSNGLNATSDTADAEKDLWYEIKYQSNSVEPYNGTFYIDLLSPTNADSVNLIDKKLFNNEFYGQLNFADSNQQALENDEELHLYSSKTISPKASYKLSAIFNRVIQNMTDFDIIGFTYGADSNEKAKNWINGIVDSAAITPYEATKFAQTYNGRDYVINKVTYTAEGELYKISKMFYCLGPSGSFYDLITVNYNSGEEDAFLVNSNPFAESKISSSDMLVSWKNDDTTGVFGPYKLDNGSLTLTGNSTEYLTFENNSISATWDNLVKYKNANPNENFLKTKCNLTYIYTATYSFSDVEVRFLLPENQTISVFYTAETLETGKQDVNIFDSNIKIPTSSGYKTLTKEDISSLTEQNSNYVEISNEFKVELNLVAIQNYFDTYESSYLKIELNLITQRGDSVAIDIYVKLNTAT